MTAHETLTRTGVRRLLSRESRLGNHKGSVGVILAMMRLSSLGAAAITAVVLAAGCSGGTTGESVPTTVGSTTIAHPTASRIHKAASPAKRATRPTTPTLVHPCNRPARAGEALGGIAIYDSKPSIRARLGVALGFGRDGDVSVWRYRDLSVEFAAHQGVVRVVATSPGATTNDGIGVGSSGESLIRVYRGHLRSSFVSFYGPGSSSPRSVSAYGFDATYLHSGLSFRLAKDTVQQVQLDGGCPVQRLSDDGGPKGA